MTPLSRLACLTFLVAVAGCSSDEPKESDDYTDPITPEVAWPTLECDSLVPSYCAFPFPSNVFTMDDAATETGRHVELATVTLPVSKAGVTSDPAFLRGSDGFSPNNQLMAHFPGVSEAGLPRFDSVERSLEPDSPTVVIDAETGEWIPHFTELDRLFEDPEQRTFIIRPVVRLADSSRYIVAIRGLVDADGNPLGPSPAFRALRNKKIFDEDPSIDERRGLYEDIFQRLADAGVERENLLLAWDFSTASKQNNTRWMTHMRDEALAAVGDAGPSYVIDNVETNPDGNVAYRIEGRMTAPLYLTDGGQRGSTLTFGDDGLPEPNPDQPTFQVPFEVMIPQSASRNNPAALLQYGHGLFGSRDQIGSFGELINRFNMVIFAVNLTGMDGEEPAYIADVISSGQMERIQSMFDRLHQGMLNYLVTMRMMRGGFSQDPTYGELIDPSRRYYHGISQGGIFGGTYMSLSTEVERGVLGVMGQPYSLLLNRSVDFNYLRVLMNVIYPDARDQQLLLALVQMLWDRTEPGGYTPYLRDGSVANGQKHEVLMRAAVGDHQVTTIGAHIMARSVGAPHLDTGVRDVFGLTKQAGPITGSAFVEYEFGLPPDPDCDIPQSACDDPHGKIRSREAALLQLNEFLSNGVAQNFCDGGVCSYPELSGCEPGETTPECTMP